MVNPSGLCTVSCERMQALSHAIHMHRVLTAKGALPVGIPSVPTRRRATLNHLETIYRLRVQIGENNLSPECIGIIMKSCVQYNFYQTHQKFNYRAINNNLPSPSTRAYIPISADFQKLKSVYLNLQDFKIYKIISVHLFARRRRKFLRLRHITRVNLQVF